MSTPSSPDAPASPENPPQQAATGRWRRLVGDWDWQPPPWIPATRAWFGKQPPGRYAAVAALLMIAALVGLYVTRPKVIPPGALVVSVVAPTLTDYTQTP